MSSLYPMRRYPLGDEHYPTAAKAEERSSSPFSRALDLQAANQQLTLLCSSRPNAHKTAPPPHCFSIAYFHGSHLGVYPFGLWSLINSGAAAKISEDCPVPRLVISLLQILGFYRNGLTSVQKF
jgi:hypothetical protein